MEILFEILAALLQLLGEILLQILVELLAELGLHGVREAFRRPKPAHPLLAALGYSILGAGAGAASLLVFPVALIHSARLQVLNLLLTPIVAGLFMTLVGAWRRRRDQEPIQLDRFVYGFLFALGTSLVRYYWGHHG